MFKFICDYLILFSLFKRYVIVLWVGCFYDKDVHFTIVPGERVAVKFIRFDNDYVRGDIEMNN